VAYDPQARVGDVPQRLGDRRGRAVVRHDHLHVRNRLGEHARDALPHGRVRVVRRHQDGRERLDPRLHGAIVSDLHRRNYREGRARARVDQTLDVRSLEGFPQRENFEMIVPGSAVHRDPNQTP